jgi:hypothetical protein
MRCPSEKRALCGICPAGCWVIVTYDQDGRIASVRADDTSELRVICKLGEHSADIVYSTDRLRYPMRRKGPKGSYDFERITWDEAYDCIVGKLKAIKTEYGAEANAIYTGRGSFELSISSGSACRSGSPKPSSVLLAIGLSEEEAHCTARLSLGPENTFEEIDRAAVLFEEVVSRAWNSVRFVPCR